MLEWFSRGCVDAVIENIQKGLVRFAVGTIRNIQWVEVRSQQYRRKKRVGSHLLTIEPPTLFGTLRILSYSRRGIAFNPSGFFPELPTGSPAGGTIGFALCIGSGPPPGALDG